jgi:FixJ family two-component response regulator
MRRALGRQLQILGFDVVVFQNAEALLASEFPTDDACLLLDVYMPGMNGIELCLSLAASGRNLPTILMSARDDRTTRQIMRQVKPIAQIFKPFDEQNLLRVIGRALRKGPNLLH